MDTIRHIELRWWRGTWGAVTERNIQFFRAASHTWQPAINAFRCATAVRVCMDLAGIEKSAIDLRVEPRRVTVRGSREAPQPTDHALQMLALEIDYGPFERVIDLAAEVDVEKVHAEQENGLLWIYLPLKH
jgi:HSP20 family protein